jgi:capsid protein
VLLPVSLWTTIAGWFGRRPSAARGAPSPRRLTARWDASRQNEDHFRYWAQAVLESPTAAAQPGIRQILRNRSRYERDNNGYCGGMIRARANDLVGIGPTLQILIDDEELTRQIEQAFGAWAKAVHLAEKLHLLDQARNCDGEAFAVLRTNPAVANPVKLDIHPVEADRVAPPWGTLYPITPGEISETQYYDGITYDDYGNAVSYSVLRQHPGDLLQTYPRPCDEIPAAYMLHWFRRERPGQLRGIPEMVASLPLFAYLRRWTLATIQAAETAAEMGAAVLESPAPADDTTVEPSPFSSVDIERGMLTELPGGYKLSQLQATFPQTSYPDFKREILAEAARPLDMPVNVAIADSSRHNFSSAKLDHYGYRSSLKTDRAFCEAHTVERIFLAWAEEAMLIPGLLPAGVDVTAFPRSWYWPGWPSMDKDEAKNTTEQLHNGTTTLAEECAEEGKDWRDQVRQMGKEARLREQEGVPLPAPGGAAPAATGGGTPPVPPVNAWQRNGVH